MDPIRLTANQPTERPYLGGAGILALRGDGSTDDYTPEDFVASTTTVHGSDQVGLSVLPDGRTLRDAIISDPAAWLGDEHVRRFGADPSLLVKILSTGERLFNHVHPDAVFAREHLASPRGKTEAWLIVDTETATTATVWLGFRRDVEAAELREWFEHQDVEAMLDALNPVTVCPGDWLYVPAGTPHSIGTGITLVEIQEPSDLSLVLEYANFPTFDQQSALLGLDIDTALDAVNRQQTTSKRLRELHQHAPEGARVSLLPAESAAYFRADRLTITEPATIEPGFSVLVVIAGVGELTWADGMLPLQRGSTVVVPHGAGAIAVTGELRMIRCAPPAAV